MNSRRIRLRLTACYAAISIAILAAAATALYLVVSHATEATIAADLAEAAAEPDEAAATELQVAQLEGMLAELRWALLVGCPLVVVVAAAGGYWMSGRALAPVEAGVEQLRRFTADASHELRTPVAILRTTSEVMASSSAAAAEHRAEWEHVATQTVRMSTLIDDLLILARSDAGGASASREVMDAVEVVGEALAGVRVLADAAEVRLRTSLLASCPMIGSPDALRRIVLALVDNAIKYTPAGGDVSVQMSLVSSRGDRCVGIAVSDTGIGIAPGDLLHVFDRFYRVSADRSRDDGGTGLGLAIARSLAESCGGLIEASSTPGRGSVFRVTLPLA